MMAAAARLFTASTDRLRSSAQSTPTEDAYNSDVARKRRKYIPGGPGGGGRWVGSGGTPVPRAPSVLTSTPRVTTPRPGSMRPVGRPRRERPPDKPTYDSAAEAAAAASNNQDGYKPREERSWDEFHPDLDLDMKLQLHSAEEVDGFAPGETWSEANEGGYDGTRGEVNGTVSQNESLATPAARRRPGRPTRHSGTMLTGLGSPPAKRIVPTPAQNPREKLTLPKPSFRPVEIYEKFEEDKANQVNYVEPWMERVGYQKTDRVPKYEKIFRLDEDAVEEDNDGTFRLQSDSNAFDPNSGNKANIHVEYDMDEQDEYWLEAQNIYRKEQEGTEPVKPAIFEVTMTLIEKEWHALERRIPKPNPKPPQTQRPRSGSAAAVNGEVNAGEEQDSKCAVCDDGDCENTNAIVFCDGCDLAVHQECYGVPFIPEGQWLCRKCTQVGRGTPTCVFCPNTEGAFKLTTEARWAHLVCAIWIRETSLGNATFMEPIMGVGDIPNDRWHLDCCICRQKMGAPIQCAHRNCYRAYHVTCARRAKYYMKMKSAGGGVSLLDKGALKSYCHSHSPPDWKADFDLNQEYVVAQEYFRKLFHGKRWADSKKSALALVPSEQFQTGDSHDQFAGDVQGDQKRKRQAIPKHLWRLPSGAPIVPQVVLDAVETQLQKFTVRKRKEFVQEACKYWTLKREARRGASLLKRLQLQMETFSTSEITRRDFAALGSVGRLRLDRRIEFAEQLEEQMTSLLELCRSVKDREQAKLKDVEQLRLLTDTVYFPITPLLWQILEKAVEGDTKNNFAQGFTEMATKLEDRYYHSVTEFSAELATIIHTIAGFDAAPDAIEAHNQLSATSLKGIQATLEQKEIMKVAKRIIARIQPTLRDALRKEAELSRRSYVEGLESLDTIFDFNGSQLNGIKRESKTAHINRESVTSNKKTPNGLETQLPLVNGDAMEVDESGDTKLHHPIPALEITPPASQKGAKAASGRQSLQASPNAVEAPATPNGSHSSGSGRDDHTSSIDQGGIPWYMEHFEPSGTTIFPEKYSGREALREMSEELTDLDDEGMNELSLGVDIPDTNAVAAKLQMAAKKKRRARAW